MVKDSRSTFVSGLRVTADHLQQVQDALSEAVVDIRRTIGVGKIAWGLRATVDGDQISLRPGLAFAPGGARLEVDSAAVLSVPAGDGPWRVVLRGAETDREELRVGETPTLISLVTTPSVEADDGSALGEDALAIGAVTRENGPLALTQNEQLYVAVGHHSHSGNHFQDDQGRWHFDGPELQGQPGPQGDKGDKGDSGVPGPTGAKGAKGSKGDFGGPGPTGAKGAKGSKGDSGDPGPAGAKGAKGGKGDSGDPGPAGAKGAKGSKGDSGDSGPAGAKGAEGSKGDSGDPGPAGAKGAKGSKGDRGNPGPAGAKGAKGSKGDRGNPGPAGAKGDRGEPGQGVDPAWPFVAKVSWKQGVDLTPTKALNTVSSLTCRLSEPLDSSISQSGPQVMQVWFEPDSWVNPRGSDLVKVPAQILTLHGRLSIESESLVWTLRDDRARVVFFFKQGGRVLIRVHCGHLLDRQQRPFSGSLDGVLGMQSPHTPGGTLESWFFVSAG